MNPFLRRIRLIVTAALLAALPGCVSMDPAAMSTLPGDLMSMPYMVKDIASRPTDAYDVARKVNQTLALIAVVRRYAELTAPQKQRVEQVVTRRYNGMVAREKKALAPRYASRKAEVQKRGAARVAEARKKSPAAAAKAETETKKEVEKVDLEWDKAARSSVAKNQGTDFAVPVRNSSGKAVVAFASVKESGVSVSNSAYEVEGTTAALNSNKKISHSGRTYAVLDEKVSL